MGFVKNTSYYRGEVYEFNLPTGHSCPFADQCLVKVHRSDGVMLNKSKEYRCYAASAERFPGVRNSRWNNFDEAKNLLLPDLPADARAVRIHMSGDFFNQKYFDTWLNYASVHINVEFWAYTKSLPYWVKRIGIIPDNLTLTASRGGRVDHLIDEHGLKNVTVVKTKRRAGALPIDTNDDLARIKDLNFALLDNF